MLAPDLEARARAWAAADPDPATRQELEKLLEAPDADALAERFGHPLEFGTAGLRGPLGAGPARMNRLVVRQTSAGLARYLVAQGDEEALGPVVVGRDARHGSAEFAQDSCTVLAGYGLTAMRFTTALPTPITAFAVKALGAAAGVMITASHNPAPDNGYKVYWRDGAQVVPPHDAGIAAEAQAAGLQPLPPPPGTAARGEGTVVDIDERALLGRYAQAVTAVLDSAGPRRLHAVYTPVHGVGGAVLPKLMEEAGFPAPSLVTAQALPDPDFPTAPFPNPEEPGVMDLSLAQATAEGADVVLANDPDADRLAVAVPVPGTDAFRVLTGDQLGCLIGDHMLSRGTGPGRLVATTIVSSSLLAALARHYDATYAETLTGFKWVARTPLLHPGTHFVFGYEEALGYSVTPAVGDKDGLSAALVVAEMVALAKERGTSLLERWDDLESQFGVHDKVQWTLRLPGSQAADALPKLMGRLRSAPPKELGGMAVTNVVDLLGGQGDLPPSDVLVFRLGDNGRVVLRPSGTEPKLKAYLEATSGPSPRSELDSARRDARRRIELMQGAVAELVSQP